MNIKDVQKFAQAEHERLEKYYKFENHKMMNLPIMVKIMEELGELSNEVLANSGLQRKEKLSQMKKDNLAEEFADVVLTSFILAHNMEVDLEKGINNKMEKIEKRYHEKSSDE